MPSVTAALRVILCFRTHQPAIRHPQRLVNQTKCDIFALLSRWSRVISHWKRAPTYIPPTQHFDNYETEKDTAADSRNDFHLLNNYPCR